MIRGIALIIVAVISDALTIGLALGATGASAAVAWIPVFGQLSSALGFGVAITISTILSFQLGLVLILLTVIMGYSPWRLIPAFFEVLPGFCIFPGWTGATIYCILTSEKPRESEGSFSIIFGTSAFVSPYPHSDSLFTQKPFPRMLGEEGRETIGNRPAPQSRVELTPLSFQKKVDGIGRAANENTPRKIQKLAA